MQKITSLAQPRASWSAVRRAVSFTTWPISRTASMLMPALVEPMATEEHTMSVVDKASGMERIRFRSPWV